MITTEKLESIGLRHWQKNGMDRIYINISGDAEYDERTIRCFFNRLQWQSLKVYWDAIDNKLVITTGDDDARAAVTAYVESLIK